MIGRARIHGGSVTSLAVCHDARTLVVGCSDGSVQSYVIVDVQHDDNWSHLLSGLDTRQTNNSFGVTTAAPASRSWDNVAVC